MRIALGVEYDGSPFCGWQTQPSGCGVQDALEGALAQIADQRIETQCAGRTDAGVHALGQVVHFDTEARRPLTAWVRGVNALLPRTIAVTWAREVDDGFHARYRARGRAYAYLLLNRAERPGLHHGHLGWHHRPLDLEPMREAAAHLLGMHDFSAFRAAECQARSPVKELRRLEIERRGRCAGVRVRRRRVPPSHGAQHRRLPGQGRRRQPRARLGQAGAGSARPRARGAHLPGQRPVSDGRGVRRRLGPASTGTTRARRAQDDC